ncbi:MAG: glycosyltransferase family 4 protein [Cyclobacteriaceae bacterium]
MTYKVLRITKSLDFGGIEKVFELHARYHQNGNYELAFVALHRGGRTAQILSSLGYRTFELGRPGRIPSFSALIALIKLFKAEKPDVVHTCGAEANFHGLWAGFITGVRIRVAEEIGIPAHSIIANLVFRVTYLLADKVIAISNAVANYLAAHEVSKDKVRVVYNPIEEKNPVQKPKLMHGQIRFCFLGRLEPIKNCEALINLMATLVKSDSRDVVLWIIGDGGQRPALENLVRDNGLTERVKFWGYVAEPGEVLGQCHIFLLPSWNEGFGLACVEAIQSGLIVVVSYNGGMNEFIADGINGFLIDPSSTSDFYSKVLLALNQSDDERQRFSASAVSTINTLFSPTRYLSALESLYKPEA